MDDVLLINYALDLLDCAELALMANLFMITLLAK